MIQIRFPRATLKTPKRKSVSNGMRRILLLPFLLIALGWPAKAQDGAGRTAEAEAAKTAILKMESQFKEALLASDTRVLTGLWSDDFFYVGTNGELLTKAQRLTQLRSGTVRYDAIQQDDSHLIVYGDTVVVSGRNTSTLLVAENGPWGPPGVPHLHSPGRLSGNALFTHVYVRLHGRWQMTLEHVTYITED